MYVGSILKYILAVVETYDLAREVTRYLSRCREYHSREGEI